MIMDSRRRGAAGQQYALVIGLIAVLGILAVTSLGANVRNLFVKTSNTLGAVTNGTGATSTGGGGGTADEGAPLFAFTTHTFTPCTATGQFGPLLTDCRTSYSTAEAANWKNNTSVYAVTAGIQQWTVPASGNYRITAQGAVGGCTAPGTPATMAGTFSLTRGTVLHLLVGQAGLCIGSLGSGGGGSFVVGGGTTPLLVAGGGGGGAASGTAGSATTALDADNPASAQNCGAGRGGINGGGGGGSGNYSAAGGGGYYTNGGNAGYGSYGASGGNAGTQSTAGGNPSGTSCPNSGGKSFLNGGAGGNNANGGCYVNVYPQSAGGFGGGGASGSGNTNGGGGGGWSGGAGGHYNDSPCANDQVNQSTGGASYNSGASPSNAISGTGAGFITVTKL